MIFSEIHIDGFGIFNSFSRKNLKRGINILLGDNETGKSTLLKFLKYTLFGYPRLKDQRMSPLYGGDHGGRIKGILSTGKEVVFERKGDNQINLVYEGNISQNEIQWLQLLGNATRDIYENVYAFSLDELLNIDSLSVSGVEDKIFSIGAGMGNISIGEVSNDIQDSVDQIYSQRGSKQTIPVLLKTIQERRSGIKAIQENLPRYRDLIRDIQDLSGEVSEIGKKLKDDREEKEKLENYLKCYESFVVIVRIDEEMAELPEPEDYPKDGPEKLNELEREEKELNKKIEELNKGSAGENGIEDIEEELKSISFNDEILKEKAKVIILRTNLEKYKQTITDRSEAAEKISDLDRTVHEQIKVINSDWTEQNIIDFANILVHQDRIKDFKAKLENIEKEKIELESQKKVLMTGSSRINLNNVFILISIILMLASIPAFYYSLNVVGIMCVVTAFMIFFGRRYLIKENAVDRIGEQLLQVDDKEKGLRNIYGNYLEKELNLKGNLSFDSVIDTLNTVIRLKRDIMERDELSRKQKTARDPFIHSFEQETRSVGKLLKSSEPENDIEAQVNQVAVEFDYAEQQSIKKERLEESLSLKKKELVKSKNNLTRNNNEITDLLKLVNAADRNDFRTKYEVNDKVKELIERRKNATNTIETIAGINRADDVIGFLGEQDQSSLRQEVAILETRISLMTEEVGSRNKQIGEKNKEIKQIAGESELAEKMTELEMLRQNLTEAYREWMTGKIALKLLTEVREKYEKEKQPVIIQNSIKYFDRITGGRYSRIHVALEKREITVFDSREVSKTIDQLSRGTREQLLVSLRLGFIEEYESRTEPLPVVVDEILVNFDPERALKTAEILSKFGENRQVIIFTCHPSTKDYFVKSAFNLIELK